MPRTQTPRFRCQPLQALARQLLFAPPDRRIDQVRRCESLHDQIEPDINYPLDFLVYRITGYRSETDSDMLLVGQAVLPDLRTMIDVLSRSVDLPLLPGETCETPEQLAQRLDVSVRTLTRWRAQGLRWRWIIRPGHAHRSVIYPARGVAHFLQRHAALVERASRFTQIDPRTRAQLLQRARRIAQARQVSLNRVATHLARKTGRALETIRLLLEKHDRQHPQTPIFADRTGPLTPRQKRVIARALRRGIRVADLAARFHRTRGTLYRAAREARAAQLRALPLTCRTMPDFDLPDADARFLAGPDDFAPPSPAVLEPVLAAALADLPPGLRPLFDQPVLEPRQQQLLIVRFNYLKHRVLTLRDQLDRYDPHGADLDRIDALLARARRIGRHLIIANLPSVLLAARKHLLGLPHQPHPPLPELLEAGVRALIDARDNHQPGGAWVFVGQLHQALTRCFTAMLQTSAVSGPRAQRRDQGQHAADRILRLIDADGLCPAPSLPRDMDAILDASPGHAPAASPPLTDPSA